MSTEKYSTTKSVEIGLFLKLSAQCLHMGKIMGLGNLFVEKYL